MCRSPKVPKCFRSIQCRNSNNGNRQLPIGKNGNANTTKVFFLSFEIFKTTPSPSGLGTSTAKEAKEYFSNMERHRIAFKYESTKDDLAIQLAFNSALADDRKDWIKWHTEDINQRRQQNLPADYLYRKDTKQINFNDFVNKELVLFSKSSTERAIPNIMVNEKTKER